MNRNHRSSLKQKRESVLRLLWRLPEPTGRELLGTVVRQEPRNVSPPLLFTFSSLTGTSWPLPPQWEGHCVTLAHPPRGRLTSHLSINLLFLCPSPLPVPVLDYGKAQTVPVWVPCWFSRGLMRAGYLHVYHSYAHSCISHLVLTFWDRRIM